MLEPWAAWSVSPLLFLPVYLRGNVGAAGSASHHLVGSTSCNLAFPGPQSTTSRGPPAARRLAASPLCPGCPSPPLLLVWMNVSSLSPWLSDFHTVRFSVISGGFLFLNCCCPFGCVRRHSVSTYTSILSRSSHSLVLKGKN